MTTTVSSTPASDVDLRSRPALARLEGSITRARANRVADLSSPFLEFLSAATGRTPNEFTGRDTLTELETLHREPPGRGSLRLDYAQARFDTEDHVRWIVRQYRYPRGWTDMSAHIYLTSCTACGESILTSGVGVDDLVALRTFRLEDSLPEGAHDCPRDMSATAAWLRRTLAFLGDLGRPPAGNAPQ